MSSDSAQARLFRPAVAASGLVFVSGQASVGPDGAVLADSFEGEMRRALANLDRVLGEAGLGLDDVVQVRAYVDESASLPAYNRIYLEYFREPLPTRTTLIGCLGGVVRFEIEAVAACRREG